LPALLLLDLGCPRQQRFEIAVLADQLCRRLDADARHSRHIVRCIADQRLDVHDLVWRHAEFLDHFVGVDAALVAGHRIEHHHARAYQLHQVLVAGDDRHVSACLYGDAGIGRNEVVGFEPLLLDRNQAEGADRVAHQRELRH
jgi:hypothetical protein